MNLFDATTIGSLTVKNHFVRSATYEGKATEEGYPTEAVKKIYQDLSAADVGTIITSYSYITNYEQPEQRQLGIYDDKLIDSYKDIIAAVHANHSKIIMQIVHGSSSVQGYPETAKVLGPSAITHPVSGITPKEMSKEDIATVIQYFVDAAMRVKKAGFDGVQLHCAHGYLLSQFISPIFNQRTDEYGGSVENRLRFVMEVYQAVRNRVGDYPIWIKMNSSDEVEGGLTTDEFIEMALMLVHAGIDVIEISGNSFRKRSASEHVYYKDAAVRLSQKTDVPIILTGGVRTFEDMEQVCACSSVNLFGFSRPFLKDIHFIQTLQNESLRE